MSREITIQELLDAGVHYGHVTRKWNPKMNPYIFGKRNGIHIIDLSKTLPMLNNALEAIKNVTSNYGRILFVATKNQASDIVKEAAVKCGQYYVNHRWLGGMLTNWKTIKQSIKKMKDLENIIANPADLTKKEIKILQTNLNKLESAIGGIRDMGGRPDLIVVIDTNRESIAIKEACKLGVPVVAVVDSDANPDNINYIIPGNDDATKAIELYCSLFAEAALEGLQQGMTKSGIDIGSSEKVLDLNDMSSPNKDKEFKKEFKGEHKPNKPERKQNNQEKKFNNTDKKFNNNDRKPNNNDRKPHNNDRKPNNNDKKPRNNTNVKQSSNGEKQNNFEKKFDKQGRK